LTSTPAAGPRRLRRSASGADCRSPGSGLAHLPDACFRSSSARSRVAPLTPSHLSGRAMLADTSAQRHRRMGPARRAGAPDDPSGPYTKTGDLTRTFRQCGRTGRLRGRPPRPAVGGVRGTDKPSAPQAPPSGNRTAHGPSASSRAHTAGWRAGAALFSAPATGPVCSPARSFPVPFRSWRASSRPAGGSGGQVVAGSGGRGSRRRGRSAFDPTHRRYRQAGPRRRMRSSRAAAGLRRKREGWRCPWSGKAVDARHDVCEAVAPRWLWPARRSCPFWRW
jgi:hypothetical protein